MARVEEVKMFLYDLLYTFLFLVQPCKHIFIRVWSLSKLVSSLQRLSCASLCGRLALGGREGLEV